MFHRVIQKNKSGTFFIETWCIVEIDCYMTVCRWRTARIEDRAQLSIA